jgi:hypothetical protein
MPKQKPWEDKRQHPLPLPEDCDLGTSEGIDVDLAEPREFKTKQCSCGDDLFLEDIQAHCEETGCPLFSGAGAHSSGPDISFTFDGRRYLIDVTLLGATGESNCGFTTTKLFDNVAKRKIGKYGANSARHGCRFHVLSVTSHGVISSDTDLLLGELCVNRNSSQFHQLKYEISRGAMMATAATLNSVESSAFGVTRKPSPADTLRQIFKKFNQSRTVFRVKSMGPATRQPGILERATTAVLSSNHAAFLNNSRNTNSQSFQLAALPVSVFMSYLPFGITARCSYPALGSADGNHPVAWATTKMQELKTLVMSHGFPFPDFFFAMQQSLSREAFHDSTSSTIVVLAAVQAVPSRHCSYPLGLYLEPRKDPIVIMDAALGDPYLQYH